VGFTDVKNPVIGAVVKHAGKQVSYVQEYIISYTLQKFIHLTGQSWRENVIQIGKNLKNMQLILIVCFS